MAKRMLIKKTSVCDLVIEEIKTIILGGEYGPGDKLPSEVALMQRFGVGRGSIREALKRLEMVGMVNIIQGKGVIVADQDSIKDRMRFLESSLVLTVPQVKDLMAVRRMLEQEAAKMAAQHATPEQLTTLNKLTKNMSRSVDHTKEFIRYDIKYHMLLAEASGNTLLPLLLNSVRDLIEKQQETTTPMKGATKKGNQYHQQICSAIAKKDSDAAGRLMLEHIDEIEKTFLHAKDD